MPNPTHPKASEGPCDHNKPTRSELEAMLEYCEAATEGPWEVERKATSAGYCLLIGPFGACIYHDTRGGVCNPGFSEEELASTAKSIAKSRTDFPRVIRLALELMDEWSFDTLVDVGKRILAEHYPESVFDGSSGDPGPEYIVALRNALERLPK